MKRKSLLGIFSFIVLSGLILTACGSGKKAQAQDGNLSIGINQFTEHPALDQVRLGFEEGLKEFGDFNVDFVSSQGDISNTLSVSQKFLGDKVDLIFAIGTPSAQASQQVAKDLPIVFSAVTDPVQAGLVSSMEKPGANITGTSDESPIDKQLALFKSIDPSIEKIGIIYSTSEANSQVQIDRAKEAGSKLGLEIETIGISNINDMPQALDSLVKKVDGIYTITDNMVASAINLVAQKALDNQLITVGAEEAHVAGGILITDGLSYFDLGRQSAKMAKEILIDKKDPGSFPVEKAQETSQVYNPESLSKLGLDPKANAFKSAKELDRK